MAATAIIPGVAYRVAHNGVGLTVLAKHPCDAICIALTFLGVLPC